MPSNIFSNIFQLYERSINYCETYNTILLMQWASIISN